MPLSLGTGLACLMRVRVSKYSSNVEKPSILVENDLYQWRYFMCTRQEEHIQLPTDIATSLKMKNFLMPAVNFENIERCYKPPRNILMKHVWSKLVVLTVALCGIGF